MARKVKRIVKPALRLAHDATWMKGLSARLTDLTKDDTIASLADETGFNRETVRRYLSRGRPSAEFVRVLCEAKGVSANWLLLGQGKR